MPVSRFAYRLATGTLDKATLQGSASYLVSNFTRAADQPVILDWSIGVYPKIRDYAVRRFLLNGKYTTQGDASFVLTVAAMTPGMMEIWDTAFFNGGVQSALATVQIPDKRKLAANQTKVYNGTIHKPEITEFEWLGTRGGIPLSSPVPYLFVVSADIS
jgi:hypothetical protein